MVDLSKNYFGNKVKIQLVREDNPVKKFVIETPKDVYDLVKDDLKNADREIFLVISLNTQNRVLGINLVSIGSLDASITHPREVFKPAILQNASSIIMVHNHPSQDIKPSKNDFEITRRMTEAGKLLGIEVVDHLIIGDNFFSFSANNSFKGK